MTRWWIAGALVAVALVAAYGPDYAESITGYAIAAVLVTLAFLLVQRPSR